MGGIGSKLSWHNEESSPMKTNSFGGYGLYCRRSDNLAERLLDNIKKLISVQNCITDRPHAYLDNKPLLVICITTGRTLTDVKDSCADLKMQDLLKERKLGAIILHAAEKHALQATNETLHYAEYKELEAFQGNVFELVYNSNKNKIHDIPSNTKVLKGIRKFLGVHEQEKFVEPKALSPNQSKNYFFNSDARWRNVGDVTEKSLKQEIMEFKQENTKPWNIAIFEHTETGQPFFVNTIRNIFKPDVNTSTNQYDNPLIVHDMKMHYIGDILKDIGLENVDCIIKGTSQKKNMDDQTEEENETIVHSNPIYDDRMHSVGFIFPAEVTCKRDIKEKVCRYIELESMKNMQCTIILIVEDQLVNGRSLYKNTEVHNKVQEWATALNVNENEIVPIIDTNAAFLNVYVLLALRQLLRRARDFTDQTQ